ncbi:hypothetical protein [Spectribacter hydrogenoxidans]|uniref:Uncharacterized protein n=1 Tax=Spectribacter hydrogenoxidans TaxID=3075608 RepID=A0ABU3C151_9GAMM|nr:hypothetical protein [Salinisphaera sp. W335]MDT0635091.1 hypothetical protein [Salinisphaera sp. W335]
MTTRTTCLPFPDSRQGYQPAVYLVTPAAGVRGPNDSPAHESTGSPTIRALAFLGAVALAGCCGTPDVRTVTRTVTVDVPVPVKADAPPELTAPPDLPLPAFIVPGDPDASSALDPDGETALRRMILELLARERAWRAWAANAEVGETR